MEKLDLSHIVGGTSTTKLLCRHEAGLILKVVNIHGYILLLFKPASWMIHSPL